MPIYKQTTEITNIDDLLSSLERDIEEVYFGDKNVFTVWGEYDGTLPATYTANGDYLADYRIYGKIGGVGDRTVNLFNKDAQDTANGYEAGHYINSSGTTVIDAQWDVTEYIPCIQQNVYCFSNCVGAAASICWYDSNKNFISGNAVQSASGFKTLIMTSPTNASYVRTCVLLTHAGGGSQQYDRNVEVFMITRGSAAPAEYVPYGYEVDMATKSRNIMPSAAAEVKTENGITISCDGEGRYYISGTAAIQTFIEFDIPQFTIPTSVGAGGNGTFSMFNNFGDIHIVFYFCNNNIDIDSWACNPAYRTHTTYNLMGGQACNKIKFKVDEGVSLNGIVAPMLTEDGTLPTIYQPYYNATTPIYIGSSPLGEDEYVDYGAGKIYRVINIFDKQSQDIQLGKAIDRDGNIVDDPTAAVSGLINISDYSDLYVEGVSSGNTVVRYIIYTGATSYVWRVIGDESAHIETDGADYMRITILQSCLDSAVISPYSTPQPQDPPVPLPQLPTVDGTTITDYAGQSAAVPSRFVAKYRKEGF